MSSSPERVSGRSGDLTVQEAWALLRDDPRAVLVDVRTDAEWAFVGLPDLSSLGKEPVLAQWSTFPGGERNDGFLAEIAGVDADAPVVFLCRSGVRSVGAADAAAGAGWARTYNVLDGFEGPTRDGHRGAVGWRAAGLPWRQA